MAKTIDADLLQKERDELEKDIARRLEHIEKILEKQHEK